MKSVTEEVNEGHMEPWMAMCTAVLRMDAFMLRMCAFSKSACICASSLLLILPHSDWSGWH